jgi:hypothetical protein
MIAPLAALRISKANQRRVSPARVVDNIRYNFYCSPGRMMNGYRIHHLYRPESEKKGIRISGCLS